MGKFKHLRKLKNLRKRKTLANFLLGNYVISFVLMFMVLLVSILISAVVAMIYFKVEISDPISPENFIKDDYTEIDSSYITDIGGYMAIVDNSNHIIFTSGNVQEPFDGKTISVGAIDDLSNSVSRHSIIKRTKGSFVYRTAYSEKGNFLMVLAIPSEKYEEFEITPKKISIRTFIAIALGLFLLIFLAVFYVYSRITSSYFLTPLRMLTNGANTLASGDYNTRIHLRTKNEFKTLSNAFNIMAKKIEREISLKEESERARKQLILDISHDLKTPLASVVGYSDYLINNPQLSPEEFNKYLSVIKRNSERANNLILDLFDYSKLDSWNFELNSKKSDICEFLRTLIASYLPLLEEKDFYYAFDIPEKAILIDFDEKNLDRALSNLIINSTKYNPPKTSLNISLTDHEDSIIICLEDNGIGIPKEDSELMFHPFRRGDESRTSKNPGTGLGLAITKAVILKHNGDIKLLSDINEGCKFIITLLK